MAFDSLSNPILSFDDTAKASQSCIFLFTAEIALNFWLFENLSLFVKTGMNATSEALH